jgi:CubicO group peptidase (beta-lactamase class C family)
MTLTTRRQLLAGALANAVDRPGKTPRTRMRSLDPAKLERVFAQAQAMDRLTSLAVYVDGQLVRQTAQNGLADDRALTNLKSITKSVMSILIGIAIDRRQIGGIDDRVAKYLPTQFNPKSGLHHLTLRHLLTMTGNLAPATKSGWAELVASPNWVDHLVAKGPTGTLGQFRYSTGDSHMLSVVLAHATSMTTLAFAQRHLFGPLGITEFSWETDPQGYHRGGNDLSLGTRDLGRIGQLMLDGGRWQGRRLVSQRWVKISSHKQTDVPDAEADPEGKLALSGYGFQWWTMKLAGHDAFLGWGNGRQYLIIVPDLRAVVTLTSTLVGAPTPAYHHAVTALIDPAIADLLASAAA